jgi:exodeoxyribonuclease VII small subunit
MSPKAKNDHLSFEQAMLRLEEIVAEMEHGAMNLDKLMANFEEGNRLLKFCNEKLNEVERKVELLVKKNGEPATLPFEPEASQAPAPEKADDTDEEEPILF